MNIYEAFNVSLSNTSDINLLQQLDSDKLHLYQFQLTVNSNYFSHLQQVSMEN